MNRVWPWRKFVTPEVTVLAAVLVLTPTEMRANSGPPPADVRRV